MTDTTINPVAAAEAPPDGASPSPTAPAAPAAVAVEHTPGGWPVLPLAVSGTNTTAALLGAAALVGGPVALALAATGAVVVGTAAATRTRRDQRRTARIATARNRAAGQGGSARMPQQRPTSSRAGTGRTGTKPSRTSSGGSHRPGKAGVLAKSGRRAAEGVASTAGRNGGRPNRSAATHGSPAGAVRGRAGQVKALRESARTAAPSRAARRTETAGARRAVADARRSAKHQARTASLARKGPIGRAAAKGLGTASAARRKAVDRARAVRDGNAAGQVARQRSEVRKAPARRRSRKALRRSAARFQGRRLLAALLAGALGMVGLATTPLGRKLGWAWLQYPGRRLYRRMTQHAGRDRESRDAATLAALRDAEAAADAEAADDGTEQIGDRAERPSGVVPATPSTTTSEGETVIGFRFEEHAAEMESAAQQYDPDNAMEILAMVEGLPAALTSVANVMRVLAERADSEFPLEKEVADGFNDIFGALMSAVAVAEDMGPLFRQAHQQDIARHEDPRNGPEAEKGWNV
ncbi:hypothetical protein AB0K47_01005 [Streptomyces tirandamycinicus]|uniref:hypothetical protein n=1 Tax=Streptomyces tirandamycinicus TaxID=2174846 RepID=UPI003430F374